METQPTLLYSLLTVMFLQLRRPLLSIPKNEPRGRSGARLSTTRRSIQPKNKPLGNNTCLHLCMCLCIWRKVTMKAQVCLT